MVKSAIYTHCRTQNSLRELMIFKNIVAEQSVLVQKIWRKKCSLLVSLFLSATLCSLIFLMIHFIWHFHKVTIAAQAQEACQKTIIIKTKMYFCIF